MLENTGSAAILKISANKNSIIQLKKDGILVHQFNNDEGYISVLDSNEIVFLYNITQFGTYIVTATYEGIEREEKIEVNDIKDYEVSVKILFIYSSLNNNLRSYTTQNYTNSILTFEDNDVTFTWVGSNERGAWLRSTELTVNTNFKEYSNLCVDMQLSNLWTSADYKQRLLVTLTNKWPAGGGAAMSGDNATARLVLNTESLRKTFKLDISALSGTYYFGICGVLEGIMYNLYLA